MSRSALSQSPNPDPAAVFAAAMSLWSACWQVADHKPDLDLNAAYHGGDEFMRQIMQVAERFESWCCDKLEFDELDDVWPYLLEDHFGDACLELMEPEALASFDDSHCLRIALHLALPIKALDPL